MFKRSSYELKIKTRPEAPYCQETAFCESVALFSIHLYVIVRVLLLCQVSPLSRSASSA